MTETYYTKITFSGVANHAFALSTFSLSTGDRLRLDVYCEADTDDVKVGFEASTDGSTYPGNLFESQLIGSSDTTGRGTYESAGAPYFTESTAGWGLGNATDEFLRTACIFRYLGESKRTVFFNETMASEASVDNLNMMMLSGRQLAATAVTHLRIAVSSGNITGEIYPSKMTPA